MTAHLTPRFFVDATRYTIKPPTPVRLVQLANSLETLQKNRMEAADLLLWHVTKSKRSN
jgi:hypothetical protein